ncbi:MAG: epoxide hydrolase family protein [Litorimonas sp.]
MIQRFDPSVSPEAIADLRRRLEATRLPDPELVDDWSQGVPIRILSELLDALTAHDFQPCLDRMAELGSYRADLDGVSIHFLHRKGPNGSPALILTHGWPGGIVEFLDVMEPLFEHFDLVVPSLPGYGFSTAPRETGFGVERMADLWAELMRSLGYDRYAAQGGDWGAEVSVQLAQRHPDPCIGAHINLVSARPPRDVLDAPTDVEAALLKRQKRWGAMEMAYFRLQASRPQTLGYALADSPAGQAAWIAEKFHAWTDSGVDRPFGNVSQRRLLDLIALYWHTNSATSSARLYWESAYGSGRTEITAPVAASLYPAEIMTPSRRWAAGRYKQIVRWTVHPRGGHFAAMEEPDLFVEDVLASVDALWRAADPQP